MKQLLSILIVFSFVVLSCKKSTPIPQMTPPQPTSENVYLKLLLPISINYDTLTVPILVLGGDTLKENGIFKTDFITSNGPYDVVYEYEILDIDKVICINTISFNTFFDSTWTKNMTLIYACELSYQHYLNKGETDYTNTNIIGNGRYIYDGASFIGKAIPSPMWFSTNDGICFK